MSRPSAYIVIPTPFGAGTSASESISGYFQRLASQNYISVSSMVKFLTDDAEIKKQKSADLSLNTLDINFKFLTSCFSAFNRTDFELRQLSLISAYETFYGPIRDDRDSSLMFFCSPYGHRAVDPYRRWCSACLRDSMYYRQLWQFNEVTVCLLHGCLLNNLCNMCNTPIPTLGTSSILDRCERCFSQLSRQATKQAPIDMIQTQRDIQANYVALLTNTISFKRSDVEGITKNWRAVIVYLREQRHLTRKQLANDLGLSASTLFQVENGLGVVSLRVILQVSRYLVGSLIGMSHVIPPTSWSPLILESHRPKRVPQDRLQKSFLTKTKAALKFFNSGDRLLTVKSLAIRLGIAPRILEYRLGRSAALRRIYKQAKQVNKHVVLATRVRKLSFLSTGMIGGLSDNEDLSTAAKICKKIGIAVRLLAHVNRPAYNRIKELAKQNRLRSANQRQQSLLTRMEYCMRERQKTGLSCTRRAICKILGYEFSQNRALYCTWKKLRTL